MLDSTVFLWVFGACMISVSVFRVEGVKLSPCGQNQTAEVSRTEVTTFTCTELGPSLQIEWILHYNSKTYLAASCPPTGNCTRGDFGKVFTASRLSDTSSQVQVDPSHLRIPKFLEQGVLECKDSSGKNASCEIDFMVPAKGSCSVQTGSGLSQFQINGSCDLHPGAVSSRGRYWCEWYLNQQQIPVQIVSLTNDTYQTDCKYSGPQLSATERLYNYTIKIYPGRTLLYGGAIPVERPATPTVTGCEGGNYIPENTTVTCTCSTLSIGQSPGRLQWLRQESVIEVGDYGNDTLTLSLLLVRSDHGVTFRCEVSWVNNVTGANFSFLVGYPPISSSLSINAEAQSEVMVREHQSVELNCTSSGGRPQPTVTLVKKDGASRRLLASGVGVCGLRVGGASCEDGGDYLCVSTNSMGPEVTSLAKRLLVQCSPRLSKDLLHMTITHDAILVRFDVISFPGPNQTQLEYLGPANETQGFSLNQTETVMGGNCSRVEPVAIYQSICSLTVSSVGSAGTSGRYRVTVFSILGNVSFVLEVSYSEKGTTTTNPTTITPVSTTTTTAGITALPTPTFTPLYTTTNTVDDDDDDDDEVSTSRDRFYLWLTIGVGSSAFFISLIVIVILSACLCRRRHHQPSNEVAEAFAESENYDHLRRSRMGTAVYWDVTCADSNQGNSRTRKRQETPSDIYLLPAPAVPKTPDKRKENQSKSQKREETNSGIYLEPIVRKT